MRISELEDIIRRKNTIITRLKKDMLVLEQKVVHLTRLRRPSSSLSVSESRDHPFMMDNIVYDMDSTTSPSSSDSDSPPVKLQDIRGNNVSLADYSGKVLLIVNVASKCGLTQSNYKELNVLYEKYKSQEGKKCMFVCCWLLNSAPVTA